MARRQTRIASLVAEEQDQLRDEWIASLIADGSLSGEGHVAPLLPTQGVFRQRPWLPWWLMLAARLGVRPPTTAGAPSNSASL